MDGHRGRLIIQVVPALLLVDDDADLGEALKEALLLEGIDVHVTDATAEAVSLAELLAPRLILVDFQLPGVDVVELVARLRQAAPAPIFLCTGMTDAGALSAEMGADGVLAKPFSIEELLGLLRAGDHPTAAP